MSIIVICSILSFICGFTMTILLRKQKIPNSIIANKNIGELEKLLHLIPKMGTGYNSDVYPAYKKVNQSHADALYKIYSRINDLLGNEFYTKH